MSTPQRFQRQRTKGWRKPEGAVYVGRPSRWGNPFVVCRYRNLDACEAHNYHCTSSADEAATKYRHAILWPISNDPDVPDLDSIVRHLRGKDLVCWCDPHQPCHADVLLELANA